MPDFKTERATASCHCGACRISFQMVDGLDSLRRCDCSLCRRKYSAAVSGLVSDVRIEAGQGTFKLYQFNTMTAKHWFCGECGVHVYHQRRSNPSQIGVNAAAIEGIDPRIAGEAEWVDGVVHPNDV